MRRKGDRPGVREGYDRWSTSYDRTPNPLVALDRRYTVGILGPRRGEHILDAGCGTGANLGAMVHAGSVPVGLDLSHGMLRTTRRKFPAVPLAQADLNDPLPVRRRSFDAVLCALVGEHLTDLRGLFRELFVSLRNGGRLVFSVFHPEMVAAGIEANFEEADVEYRLGAVAHRVTDYLDLIERSGFRRIAAAEYCGDRTLAAEIPRAAKYLDQPLLLTVQALKP